jgi:hypothetical protein
MPKSNSAGTATNPPDDSASSSPASIDAPDGGPGSHTEDQTGGVANDPASGGIPEDADSEDDAPAG